MTEEEYARKIRLMDSLRGPVLRRAFRGLSLGRGDAVLDAGCGTGSSLPLLADEAGPDGRVTGLDLSAGFLSRARSRVEELGLGSRVSLVQGDIGRLPFEEHAFDCVVSVDCAGYPFSRDPVTLLRELARVVKPSGTVAVMGWTHQQILPGYPLLESRLNTASSLSGPPPGIASGPEGHFMRAPGWFREAGFGAVSGSSCAGDILAPLDDEEKEALLSLFEMLWPDPLPSLSADDRDLFRHISEPGSRGFILDRPDYYGFFVYTCFSGKV